MDKNIEMYKKIYKRVLYKNLLLTLVFQAENVYRFEDYTSMYEDYTSMYKDYIKHNNVYGF